MAVLNGKARPKLGSKGCAGYNSENKCRMENMLVILYCPAAADWPLLLCAPGRDCSIQWEQNTLTGTCRG